MHSVNCKNRETGGVLEITIGSWGCTVNQWRSEEPKLQSNLLPYLISGSHHADHTRLNTKSIHCSLQHTYVLGMLERVYYFRAPGDGQKLFWTLIFRYFDCSFVACTGV